MPGIMQYFSPVEAAAETVPERIGDFAIEGVLGRGGSGMVYAARQGDTPVALKVLRADQVPTPKERRRFITEAQNMARIRHPNVVNVIAVGELEDGRPYLAMERLPGANLAATMAAGPLGAQRALSLFDQLAAAVAAMHDAGLLHRDLKPENAMIVPSAGGERCVLLDFGIAKDADAPPSTTTQAGMQRGTPAYMAPERFFGSRASIASDIYELAVILYVMLVGRIPWKNPMDAGARLSPTPPSESGIELPPALEAVLLGALSTNAEDRPATARALADEVRRASFGGNTEAWATAPTELAPTGERPDRAETTEKTGPSQRTVALVAAGAMVVVGAVALTLYLAPGPDEPAPSPAPAQAAAAPQIPPDAAAPVVVSIDAASVEERIEEPAPAPPPKRKRPAASRPAKKQPRTPTPALPQAGGSTKVPKTLPGCRKVRDLYCSEDFKATEGNLRGKLCDMFTEQVATWEAMDDAPRASMVDYCAKNSDALLAAARERIRQFKAGIGPIKPKPSQPE